MRADRLVALVLLLRRRGQLTTAAALARELEVTPRTVLRDIEALSAAGVPVYSERGRNGGFALLPGFGAELSGLNHDEALALLVAGSARGQQAFGLGSALTSAVRKVLAALPETHRTTASDAARRLLVDPEADLVNHRVLEEGTSAATMAQVRRAVVSGHRLRIQYAARQRPAQWRTVDPIGLVTVGGREYLLALRAGEERTYRLSRLLAAQELDESAQRPDQLDLDRIWRERCAEFRSTGEHVTAEVLVDPARREEVVSTALAVHERGDTDGLLRLEITFPDAEHAEFALWRLATDGEVIAPQWLRDLLRRRAVAIATHYTEPGGDGSP